MPREITHSLEVDMKAKAIALTLFVFFAAIVCFAQDAQMGTWKLNHDKSKFAPGATKNTTVVYEAAGDSVKITVNGTDRNGNAVRHEWTGKFDGADYPVTGDPDSDARSYKQVNDRTLEFTAKKGGNVTIRGKVVVSADGKIRTVTTQGTNPQGKKVKNIAVYDKQ
jgi:hypothetical protein